jgi:hypothetical protein
MARDLPSLTQEEMIIRGAYGFLGRAYECEIPVGKVVEVTPEPACERWAPIRMRRRISRSRSDTTGVRTSTFCSLGSRA